MKGEEDREGQRTGGMRLDEKRKAEKNGHEIKRKSRVGRTWRGEKITEGERMWKEMWGGNKRMLQ